MLIFIKISNLLLQYSPQTSRNIFAAQAVFLTICRRLKLRLLQSASEISFRFRQDAKCFHWHASNSLCECVRVCGCACGNASVVVNPLAVICMPLKLCKVILSRPLAKSASIFAIVNVISGFKCELHLSCHRSTSLLAPSQFFGHILHCWASVGRANIWPP